MALSSKRLNLTVRWLPLGSLSILVLGLLLWVSCGDSGGGTYQGEKAPDMGAVVPPGLSDVIVEDVQSLSSDAVPGAKPETGEGGDPEAIISLDSCGAACECEKQCGLPCVVHIGEYVCPPECEDPEAEFFNECGGDGEGENGVSIISTVENLCRPCITSLDCAESFQSPDKCVALSSSGRFCGVGCASTDDCPSGYECRESTATEPGPPLLQCVPKDSDTCPCTNVWSEQGASTVCYLENAFGSCLGYKVCQDGLSFACQGEPAIEEVANGLDEDCDGSIDEDICTCGDDICDFSCSEDKDSCPYDCKECGDNICSPSENPLNCKDDCCGTCGDGQCIGYACGETPQDCPEDCGTACGNGVCEKGENPVDCEQDCLIKVCGNGICEGSDGGPDECPEDCGAFCGNCECDGGESFFDCPLDCGYCGDGFCSACAVLGEKPSTCPADCCVESDEVCGNGLDDDCDGQTDEEDALGCIRYYADNDGDSAGDTQDSRCLCAPDGVHQALVGGDCDDQSDTVLFGQWELCDDVDNDCDGAIDEDFGIGDECKGNPNAPCFVGVLSCDGLKATQCINGATASSDTICAPYQCADGLMTLASVCNNGICTAAKASQISCSPYACELSASVCRTTCANDAHCAQGFVCTNTLCQTK